MMKSEKFDDLLKEISLCKNCIDLKKRNGKDCSLINFYDKEKIAKNIPSIWTDWYRKLDCEIMVVGQDWGPFEEIKNLHLRYENNKCLENWSSLIEEEKSLTKRMFEIFFRESYFEVFHKNLNCIWDGIFVTNAIMCARKGVLYRSENIDLKKSSLFCSKFLKKQIEIVQPKVILTLGYYPLLSLSKLYHFEITENLTKTILKDCNFCAGDAIIIPLFHPAAQVSKEKQLKQYSKIWKILKEWDYGKGCTSRNN